MGIFDRYDKMIHGWVERAVEATMPRQAIVTRSEGSGVWVRFTPVNNAKPEMWYPSTVAGLPAGAQGWVHPLAGGKGRFIATAVPLAMPITNTTGPSVVSTTSLTTFTYTNLASLTLPKGNYRFVAALIAPVRRDVQSGTAYATLRVNGVELPTPSIGMGGTPANQFFTLTHAYDEAVTVGDDGMFTVEAGVRGGTTSGTTGMYRALVNGTLTKIG